MARPVRQDEGQCDAQDHRGRAPRKATDVLKTGDVIRVQLDAAVPEKVAKGAKAGEKATDPKQDGAPHWRLAQVPVVQGALVSLSAADGAIQAMVGGFDFQQSKFNRVTQALRQPGSNFKPFLYSAALDAGFTPASLINDAPVVFDTPGGVNPIWRPENYGGEYNGPTRLREALSASRNLVSIRLLSAIGIDYVADYARRFGFPNERLPRDLSLALGTGVATPLEVVRGYSVFANGGYLVDPYLIKRVETSDGVLVMEADPVRVCAECEVVASIPTAVADPMIKAARPAPRVIGAENAWMMNSMMQDVIKAGTARRALALKRRDLAGKTGTTNEQRDAWFSGFNANVATTVWVGFDQVQPLGKDETGARAALPMWMNYMSVALEGMEEATMPQPQDLVTVRIDPDTGNLARSSDAEAVYETFRSNEIPVQESEDAALGRGSGGPEVQGPEQLF